MKEAIYVVHTNSGYWGKGKSLHAALKNAKVRIQNTIMVSIVITEHYDKVFCDNMAKIHADKNAEIYYGDSYMENLTLLFDKEEIIDYFELK